MLETCCGITLPEELSSFKKLLETNEEQIDVDLEMPSGIKVNKDSRGRIQSVCYYSPNGELSKQVFYEGINISFINYYKNELITSKEVYEGALLTKKSIFKKNGSEAYNITYRYVNDRPVEICKTTISNKISINYKYDQLGRIIMRKVIVDDTVLSEQKYVYDILNRILGYQDKNQKIFIKDFSEKNELLSYTITDKIGNEIIIDNHFTEYGYADTKITLNGHSVTVNDTSYVDNVMLKKPYATEDDLDLIISNLMKPSIQTQRVDDVLTKKTAGLIDSTIQVKTLPISIRKRVLFNIVSR